MDFSIVMLEVIVEWIVLVAVVMAMEKPMSVAE